MFVSPMPLSPCLNAVFHRYGRKITVILYRVHLSLVMRKPDFCICENKDADQLRGNREADQRLYFRYADSTIPLLPISEISSLYPSSLAVQPGLCWTWSETPKTGFLTTRLILASVVVQNQNSLLVSAKIKIRFLLLFMSVILHSIDNPFKFSPQS